MMQKLMLGLKCMGNALNVSKEAPGRNWGRAYFPASTKGNSCNDKSFPNLHSEF